jgi:hypothetical protein
MTFCKKLLCDTKNEPPYHLGGVGVSSSNFTISWLPTYHNLILLFENLLKVNYFIW